MFGGPIVRNRAFFFGDYEGFRQTRERRPASRRSPTPAQRQGILTVDVRDPRTGVDLSGGHADPDDRLRAPGARRRCPTPTSPATPTTTRRCRSSPPTRTRAGVKVDVQLTPAAVGVRALRHAQPDHRRPAEHPAAVRRRRQRRTSTRATSSSSLGSTWTPTDAVAARGAVRLVVDAGRQEPAGARQRQRARRVRHHRAADDDPRIAGGLPTQVITRLLGSRPAGHQPAVAVPDRLQPEDQLHLDDRRATRSRAATSSSASTPRCRTSTRSTAATPTPASSRRPAGAAANNLYNLADFMLGLRVAVRAQQRAGRQPAPATCTSSTCRTTGASTRNLTLNLGAALRVRDAATGSATTSCRTSIRRPTRMVLAKDGSIYDRALIDPDRNNFGPRLGFAYTARRRARSCAAATASATSTSAAPAAATSCRSTARR